MTITLPWLRLWDVSTAARVDHFVANSAFVAKRIEKYYRRSASVVHPPVATERFSLSDTIDDYFLCAGQVTPYKRVDIAIEAFNRLGRPLVIAGSGVSSKMRASAGPNVRFVDEPDDVEMARLLQRCRALVFPGVEDFGIIPVEAMLSGRPVIALGRGGVLETVQPGRTGLFFDEQSVSSLEEAVRAYEATADSFDPQSIRQHALQFSQKRFVSEMMMQITRITRSPPRQVEADRYPHAVSGI
jgi:glycosyltransferase involved in cell wall biosynthesis